MHLDAPLKCFNACPYLSCRNYCSDLESDVDDTIERQSLDFLNRNIFHLSFPLSSVRQRTYKQSFGTSCPSTTLNITVTRVICGKSKG
ncbi:hypothetical protein TNIN_228841 [Trichonephila inaurata madagascariensis]|uniref:Uncharacterized protein n=1 Tax=Trichonephila inaurata madagascariensis TaxID=2747483 RepID=A0A8X7CBA5_9ARAC|nr:hypothetical protein TNIN_228841 [Trichonephila inaurata madagascariensis]